MNTLTDFCAVATYTEGMRFPGSKTKLGRWVIENFGELWRFGSVGLLAYVVDVGLMNLLRFGPGQVLGEKVLTAKIVSAAVATVVAWWLNRRWTFSGQATENKRKEFLGYAAVNVGGIAIALACLWFSHYILGFTSALADNISANVIGLGLGTAFRYFGYKFFIFTGDKVEDSVASEATVLPDAVGAGALVSAKAEEAAA